MSNSRDYKIYIFCASSFTNYISISYQCMNGEFLILILSIIVVKILWGIHHQELFEKHIF